MLCDRHAFAGCEAYATWKSNCSPLFCRMLSAYNILYTNTHTLVLNMGMPILPISCLQTQMVLVRLEAKLPCKRLYFEKALFSR